MAKNTKAQAPVWGKELSSRYNASIVHGFMLHGNTSDYVGGQPGQTLKNYLMASFAKREIVLYWNRASGFVFAKQTMKQKFAELCGLMAAQARSVPTVGARGLGAAMGAAAGGVDPLAMIDQAGRQPAAALGLIDQALRATSPASQTRRDAPRDESHPPQLAVIIDYAESIVPQSDIASSPEDRQALVMLSEWGRDTSIGQRGHIIVLIASALQDVNERLRRSGARWEQLEIPFPNFEERYAFTETLLAELSRDPENSVSLALNFSVEELARLTTGLRYIDIEDILLRASYHQQPVSAQVVKVRKDEIVGSEFEEVLQLLDHEYGFESIGGLIEVKEDLMNNVIRPMKEGKVRRVPQGILLMGPPGTGKTRLARALAKEAGVTFVELQPSKIFSKWVGDTERRLERALTAIKMMTPCIVFIDEVDQTVGRGESGDSGVSNRVFKRLMEMMADTTYRGRVLWIAASNRPDLLDSAFLRPGRMDKKIPILAPNAEERAAILQVLVRQAFGPKVVYPYAEAAALAAKMEQYTGAEIEAVVGKAVQLQGEHEEWEMAYVLSEAFERIIPSTQDIERMTQLALSYCNDLDLVPSHLRDLARSVRRQASSQPDEEPEAGLTMRRRQREL